MSIAHTRARLGSSISLSNWPVRMTRHLAARYSIFRMRTSMAFSVASSRVNSDVSVLPK